MITIDDIVLLQTLDYPSLIDAIQEAFTSDANVPERHHHTISVPARLDATLLLMPAWRIDEYVGIKIATIFPSNGDVGLPSVMATYLLLDGTTGSPLATIDGKALTGLRTAATSAFASRLLSRTESSTMTMVGAGALAIPLVTAHASVRNLKQIYVWNRSTESAERVVEALLKNDLPASVTMDLEQSVRGSDVVSCASLSREPLIRGSWVREGTHIDLVGAYTGEMRETDDELIVRGKVFVDTYEGARSEAGDLIQAAESGAWNFDAVLADLKELATGQFEGRISDSEITVFKSVGSAIEDLAAARLAYERLR
ncbi:MAG: ornithine cyclodeaminase family protein [Rhodothermia bacterium]|nr:MAG: ornithine cyclodeaminase family protein [Rhodothermia bacterium]